MVSEVYRDGRTEVENDVRAGEAYAVWVLEMQMNGHDRLRDVKV